MTLSRRLMFRGFLGFLLGFGVAPASAADPYPTRPVRILVGAGPGGTADLYARIIAQEFSKTFGQPFVVENRPGASSTIAANIVAKAKPDGYMLLLGASNTHAINPHLMKDRQYDHIQDFAPVSLFATGPLLLLVNLNVPARTVPELIDLLKRNPGKYNFGSTSNGTGQHMAGELLKLMTGTQITHVPYRSGSGEMLGALMSGEIQFAFDNMTSALPPATSGQLRGIAVSSQQRMAALPEIPAMAEYLPGFEVIGWHALFAPAGTPPEIVDRMSAEIKRALAVPEIGNRVRQLGGTPVGSTPAELDRHVRLETEKFGKLVKEAGITIE